MRNRRLTSILCAALLAAPGVASASLGVAAEPWLLDQMLQAQRLGNRSVEVDALNRLMLLDADNPEFKLHWLRMQLDEPQRDAIAIDKMIASLCADETAKACRQARLIMANDDVKRRQEIIKRTYDNAVKRGDENVYIVLGSEFFPEELRCDFSVDGCHPNDIGFRYMADAMKPTLEKIIAKL